jgi:hypothetical protein
MQSKSSGFATRKSSTSLNAAKARSQCYPLCVCFGPLIDVSAGDDAKIKKGVDEKGGLPFQMRSWKHQHVLTW